MRSIISELAVMTRFLVAVVDCPEKYSVPPFLPCKMANFQFREVSHCPCPLSFHPCGQRKCLVILVQNSKRVDDLCNTIFSIFNIPAIQYNSMHSNNFRFRLKQKEELHSGFVLLTILRLTCWYHPQTRLKM